MAGAIRAHDEGRVVDPTAADRVRALAAEVDHPPAVPRHLDPADAPLGGPGVASTARALLCCSQPRSSRRSRPAWGWR